MSEINIERKHTLGLNRAREVARHWVRQAESSYGMACVYTQGEAGDMATFSRPGLQGSVEVTGDTFRLSMTLGFLMDVFKGVIEDKVTRNMDEMLAGQPRVRA